MQNLNHNMRDDVLTSNMETKANNYALQPDWALNDRSDDSLLGLGNINTFIPRDTTVNTHVDYNQLDLATNIINSPQQIPENRIDDYGSSYIDNIHSWDFGDRGSGNHPIDYSPQQVRKNNPDVVQVRPNISNIPTDNIQTKTDANNDPITPNSIPNDTYFASLWGLQKINAPAVWDYTKGSKNVVVAVVDTGVDYNDLDLAANIWTNPKEIAGNGIDDDGNGYVDDIHGWDFGDGDNNPNDNDPKGGHGTVVAGIIGAVGDNNQGVIGVSPNVSIMATKHFKSTDPDGYLWNIPQGIYYAVNNGAKVINLSFGSSSFDQDQYNALKYANDHGVLVIAAAGNSSRNIDTTPYYPATYDLPNIITVAASDQNDNLASFSNYGVNSVDLAAPGVNIYSTLPNNQYAAWSGTSMAVPYVTGAAALLLAVNPNLSVLDLRYALLSSVDKITSLQGLVNTGGRLDVFKAYQEVALNNQVTPDSLTNSTVVASAASKIHIEAENYNNAYDTTAGNQGGSYRSDLGVDIENTSDVGGGFDVTGIKTGEWLTYNLTIPGNGFYDIVARVSSGDSGQKQLKTSIDNQQEGILSFNPTGGYQTWTNASVQGVSLSAGSHELRLDMLTDNFNINYIDLIPTNTAYGGSGNDTISGNDNNNTIYGGAGNDSLTGGNGNDYIDGGDGNDILIGGNGNDTLIGGNGNDTLTGGAGADTFVFNSLSEGIDAIADFSHIDGDKIKIGSSFGATDLSLFNYNASTGALSFNNGTNFIQFATLNTNSMFNPSQDIIF